MFTLWTKLWYEKTKLITSSPFWTFRKAVSGPNWLTSTERIPRPKKRLNTTNCSNMQKNIIEKKGWGVQQKKTVGIWTIFWTNRNKPFYIFERTIEHYDKPYSYPRTNTAHNKTYCIPNL